MVNTVAGSKFSIGTTMQATNRTQFEADTYTPLGGLSNIGEMGTQSNVLQFPLISDEFVAKSKGTRNAGDPAIVVGRITDDPGQIALRAAEVTNYFYNFKLELPDAQDELHTNTIIYFRAIVASALNQLGGNEDFITETYTLGIYPRPLFVESELIPSP